MKAFNIEDVLFLDIETAPSNNKTLDSERIMCICVGKIGQDSKRYLNLRSFYNENESKLLIEFNSFLLNFSKNTILCAHNGKTFNFPFLSARMTINGIVSPSILSSNSHLNELNQLDTSEFITNQSFERFNKTKPEIKELEDIVSYCYNDIVSIAQKLLRFKNLGSVSTENIYYV